MINDLVLIVLIVLMHRFADRNTTLKNAERYGEDALPLRIIIYAPHIHKSGKKTKKYTHLLLRTDDPDFHGHLDSGVDDASPTDSWQVLIDTCRVSVNLTLHWVSISSLRFI